MRTKKAVFTLVLIAAVHAMAQTNTITFTNKSGEVVTDAKVLVIWTNDLFYETPGGGSRVRFGDLPPEVSARFGWRRWPLPATPITGTFGYNLGERLPDAVKPVPYLGHLWHFDTNAVTTPFRWVSIAALPDRRIFDIRTSTFAEHRDDSVQPSNDPAWERFLDEERERLPDLSQSEIATNSAIRFRYEEQKRRADVEAVKIATEKRFGPTGVWETNFGFSRCQWGDSNRTVTLQVEDGRYVTVEYLDLQLVQEATKSDEKARSRGPSVPRIPITGAFGYTLGEALPPTLSPDEILDLSFLGRPSTNPPFVKVMVSAGHSGIASIEAEAPTSDENLYAIRGEIEKSYGPGSWVTNRNMVALEWGDTNRSIELYRYWGTPYTITVDYKDLRLLNEALKDWRSENENRKKERMREANAEQQRQAAAGLHAFRERDSVKKTAVQISGQILQVVDNGVLFKYEFSGPYDYSLCFVENLSTTGLVDDLRVGDSTVYPIGTYTYTTTGGSSKTIKRFTVSLDRAVEWHRNNH